MATIEFQCPECGAALQVPEEVIGQDVECPACHETFETVSAEEAVEQASDTGPQDEAASAPAPRRGKKKPKRIIRKQSEPEQQTAASSAITPAAAPDRYSEYKVIKVPDSFFMAVVLGMSYVPADRIHQAIAEEVKRGWQVVFQLMEDRRFLFIFHRKAVIITFGR